MPSVSNVDHVNGGRRATLFETSIVIHQPRLFDLAEASGEEGWLKALRLVDYAPKMARRSELLQEGLFPYTEAITLPLDRGA